MAKSSGLLSFETFDFDGIPREGNSAFFIEIQQEKFKSLWEKVKGSFEDEDLDSDREAAPKLLGTSRMAYITVAASMNELLQTLLNRSRMSSTYCPAVQSNENRLRLNMQLPACTMEIFYGD